MDPILTRVVHAAEAALDKKAADVDILHVESLTTIADYFVICTATNERQSQAIADAVQERLREADGVKPTTVEGSNPGRWVLIDYGDFIVHVFTEETRRFYALERLWGDAPNLADELLKGPQRKNESQR
jgi:ribosome-associated protein